MPGAMVPPAPPYVMPIGDDMTLPAAYRPTALLTNRKIEVRDHQAGHSRPADRSTSSLPTAPAPRTQVSTLNC